MNIWDFFGRTIGGLSDRYLGTNWLSSQAAEQAFNRQQDLQNANFQFQENMMNKQNEYNTPSNMMSRLRDAGLNPHLVNGQPVATSAAPSGGSSASAPMAQGANGAGDLISAIQQGAFMNKQKELLQSEIDKNNADAAETQSRVPVNQQTAINLHTALDKMYHEIDNLQADTAKKLSDIELNKKYGEEASQRIIALELENQKFVDTYSMQIEMLATELESKKALTTQQQIQAKYLGRQLETQIRHTIAAIRNLESSTLKNNQETKLLAEQIPILQEQLRSIAISNDIKSDTGKTQAIIDMVTQVIGSFTSIATIVHKFRGTETQTNTRKYNNDGTWTETDTYTNTK